MRDIPGKGESLTKTREMVYCFPRGGITRYHKLSDNITKIYSPLVLKAKCKKSRCYQCHALSKGFRGEFSWPLPSFSWLPEILGLLDISPVSSSIITFSCVCLSWRSSLGVCVSSPILLRFISHIGLGPTLIEDDLILTWLHLQRLYF